MRDFVALLKDLLLSELTEGTRGQGHTVTRGDAKEHLCLGGV
jgi:hypothetical protein